MKKITSIFVALLFSLPAFAANETGPANTVLRIPSGGGRAKFGAVDVSQSAAVTGQLPISKGGTGGATKAAGFDALSPMTTAGDIIYGGASGTGTRLAVGATGTGLVVSGGNPTYKMIEGPVFSAYAASGQSIPQNSNTILNIDTETADTNNNFDTTTHIFTPTVAGYYDVIGCANFASGPTAGLTSYAYVEIVKNGSSLKRGNQNPGYSFCVSSVVPMNGSTDALRLDINTNENGLSTQGGASFTYFQAVFQRGL